MTSIDEVIQKLGLSPLVGEGGMWARVYASDEYVKANEFKTRDTDRPICNTIYFLLTPNSFSSMHKLKSDEIWYYHMGPSLKMLLINEDGTCETKVLGPHIEKGERPQIVVKRGTWQGATMAEDDEYTLVSTSEAPAYCDSDYTLGTFDELKDMVESKDIELLRRLTGEIKFI